MVSNDIKSVLSDLLVEAEGAISRLEASMRDLFGVLAELDSAVNLLLSPLESDAQLGHLLDAVPSLPALDDDSDV